jgi:hypothetical protein
MQIAEDISDDSSGVTTSSDMTRLEQGRPRMVGGVYERLAAATLKA